MARLVLGDGPRRVRPRVGPGQTRESRRRPAPTATPLRLRPGDARWRATPRY